jgi:hypothetical protein
MQQFGEVRGMLRAHSIRDASDYAEVLIAEVLRGKRVASRVTKGHDVITSKFGRVEVKCRQLSADGRIEQRVEVSATKESGFDHLAIVIFLPNFDVKGAVIVPYSTVWEVVRCHQYNRISYGHARLLNGAIDITAEVCSASER